MSTVEDERERCARIADNLATVWERSAKKIRAEGTFKTRALWPSSRRSGEQAAKDMEAAAKGIRDAISRPIREGWKAIDVNAI